MAITKRTEIVETRIAKRGTIFLQETVIIEEDGVEIGRSAAPQLSTFEPQPDSTDIDAKGADVAAIRAVVWTPPVIAEHETRRRADHAEILAGQIGVSSPGDAKTDEDKVAEARVASDEAAIQAGVAGALSAAANAARADTAATEAETKLVALKAL